VGAYKFKAGSRVELYNLNTGEKQSFHAIDAKTCLERGGWSLDQPLAATQASPSNVPVKAPDDPGEVTRSEIVEKLKALGVSIPRGAKKDELAALLAAKG
jgi:hypothetical protein